MPNIVIQLQVWVLRFNLRDILEGFGIDIPFFFEGACHLRTCFCALFDTMGSDIAAGRLMPWVWVSSSVLVGVVGLEYGLWSSCSSSKLAMTDKWMPDGTGVTCCLDVPMMSSDGNPRPNGTQDPAVGWDSDWLSEASALALVKGLIFCPCSDKFRCVDGGKLSA